MAWSSPRTWTTGEVVTAAHMNQEVRDNFLGAFPNQVTAASWTPTLEAMTTNPGTAGGGVTGRLNRVGADMKVWVRFVHGAGTGTGAYFVTLPVAASGITSNGAAHSGTTIGSWSARDNDSPGNNESGAVTLQSSTTVIFSRPTATASSVVSGTGPFVWDLGDVLSFHAVYPVA